MERMMSACETAHATTLNDKRERLRALLKSWQSMRLSSAMSTSNARLSVSAPFEPTKDAMEQMP